MSEATSGPVLKNVGERGDSWKSPWTNFTVLFQHRFLVRNLVRKEIRGRYRNAMLGYTWAVLEPAMLASVYYFLFIMLAGNADKMYPVWVILGIIVWSCFGKALQGTVSSLSRNGQTIHLVYFPRIIFPMAAVQGNIIISMMSCFVVLPIMVVFDLPVTIYLLYVPLSILMAGFLAIGLGMLVAPLNCAHRDIEHLFRFIVRAGFFLSPVMWTYEMALERGAFGEMVLYNPMVVPLTMIRHGIAGESIGIPWAGILWSLGFGIVMWVLGSYVFNRHEAGAVKHL
jgi:ABC-type polysaccharide/polyol phosphate export permease